MSPFLIVFDSQIAYLDANADIALVGSRYRPFIDKDANPLSEDTFPLEFSEIAAELRQFRCPLFHSSIMFRKEKVRSIGGYDESLAANEDWDLYVQAWPWLHDGQSLTSTRGCR